VSTELADVVPERVAPSAEVEGLVVIERPPPEVHVLRGFGRWFSWAMGPKKVRLDELGSFAWQRIDGDTTFAAISDAVRRRFPDQSEDIESRLAGFLGHLAELGLIET
jgi:hypothetical protein